MAELRRDDPLFDRVLPIHMTVNGVNHNLPSNLVFRILRGSQPAQAIGQSEAVYHFEVTDDRDPYFLYYFEVGEGDFPQFKREQSILVDFHAVPMKLMELLEHCLRSAGRLETKESVVNDKEAEIAATATNLITTSHLPLSSTYTAELDTVTGIFSIVEANQFNKLVHIKVPLQLGDDAAIKLYLASRLALSLSQTRRLRSDVSQLKTQQEEDQLVLIQQREEIHTLRSQKSCDTQSLRATHSEELSTLQRHHLETLEEARTKHETIIANLKQELEELNKDTHDKQVTLSRKIAELEHDKSQLTFQNQDLSRLLTSTETDRDRLLKECDDLHTRRRALEEERTTLLRNITKLDATIEGLKLQLQEKDTSMSKSLALQQASEDARQVLELRLKSEIVRNEDFQAQLNALQAEAERFQALCTRLQTDNRALKDRFRDKNDVLRKQESVVNDLRSRLSAVEMSLSREVDKVRQVTSDNEILLKRLSEAQDTLAQAEKVNASNKDTIAFLSQEMSRLQMGERIAAEPAAVSFFSSGAASASSPNMRTPPATQFKSYTTPYTSNPVAAQTPETVLRKYSTPLYSTTLNNTNTNTNTALVSGTTVSKTTAPSSYLERGARRLGLEQDLRLAVAELNLDQSSSPASEDVSFSNKYSNNKGSSVLGLRREVDLDNLEYYNTAATPGVTAVK